jgi:hypothetical protein
MGGLLVWGVGLALLGLALGVLGFARLILDAPGRSFQGALPALQPHEQGIAAELRGHVHKLAGDIGERNVWRPDAYAAAAQYISGEFAALGYAVEAQEYQLLGTDCRNLAAQTAAAGPDSDVLVVGAHYDSFRGCPAANDNASGVAALLVLARQLAGHALQRPVRFVAFANEEKPFFSTDDMGSLRYARACRERGERLAGMIALDCFGYYSEQPQSQRYPSPFGWYSPGTGNFVQFTGNLASRAFLHDVVGAFRKHGRFPSRAAALPEFVWEAGYSDHWSFWHCGYPAIIVTDTALFRYPQYHSPDDTPDRVDYDRLARVVAGLKRALTDLAGDARG